MEDALVLCLREELAALEPEVFADRVLESIGAEWWRRDAFGSFGSTGRAGDLELLERSDSRYDGPTRRPTSASSEVRALPWGRRRGQAATLLGRPRRGRRTVSTETIGVRRSLPDRQPRVRRTCSCRPRDLAGAALGQRAAISIGTNPHYGGTKRRWRRTCSTTRATSTAADRAGALGRLRDRPASTRGRPRRGDRRTWNGPRRTPPA